MADVVNEADLEHGYDDETYDENNSSTAAQKNKSARGGESSGRVGTTVASRPSTVPAGRTRRRSVHIEGMPVHIPASALNQTVSAGTVTVGSSRTRDTLIVNRSVRGKDALATKNTGSPNKNAKNPGLRDFASYYNPPKPLYNKGYLNELTYAETQKARSAAMKVINDERALRLEKKSKADYLAGHTGGKAKVESGESNSGGVGFFERQEAMEKRILASRALSKAELEFDVKHATEKLCCPVCSTFQTFAELQAGTKKCPKESCKGAVYRPKLLWNEVADSFLGRWQEFGVKREKNLAKLLVEVTPAFRMTHRHVYNKETKEMEEQAIGIPNWEGCRTAFYARNQEAVDRILAREAEADAAANKAAEVFKSHQPSKYKFTQPLPPFWDRQMAMLEKRNATFDERYEMLKDA